MTDEDWLGMSSNDQRQVMLNWVTPFEEEMVKEIMSGPGYVKPLLIEDRYREYDLFRRMTAGEVTEEQREIARAQIKAGE